MFTRFELVRYLDLNLSMWMTNEAEFIMSPNLLTTASLSQSLTFTRSQIHNTLVIPCQINTTLNLKNLSDFVQFWYCTVVVRDEN